ncbi:MULTISPECIES: Flp family type IVb pilin [Asticcacaulis]|uniref:Flp family type IVb pilin n=1 Tax=Asticcacaulis TaxID=76890 RepID=UPI001AE15E10|nr:MULTISPECIES: Flp family type IVb pilin [Asticcacaulis]MBP2159732.1 pilus assembly protein Flp/PilA [Asticcacaulis solisilvae]MDR6800777.1 pilus assembly protein Flp/PilA [Asticcacaulis sp. BE141]
MLTQFFKDERGATAIEYGLICGLIFLAIVTTVLSYGDNLHKLYIKIGNAAGGAMAGS